MATIKTLPAGVSPYPAAAAEPTVLVTTANGRPSTVAAASAVGTGTTVIVNGQAALNNLITTNQSGVFEGANVVINLEEQNFNTTNQVTATTNYPAGNTGEIQYNSGANSFASDAYFTYVNSNVVTPGIRTNNYLYANGAPFTAGGNAAIGNFVFTGDAVTIAHANSTLSITGNGTGNIQVTSNGNIWTFDAGGNLLFPNDLRIDNEGPNTRIYQTSGSLKIRAEETASLKLGWDEIFSGNANAGGNVAQIIVNGTSAGQSKNVVVLTGNESTTTYSWRFGNDGNLELPGNTFAVNYANGNPVVIGSGLPLANGTSNINIATANGNVTVTANAGNTWTFATSGNLVFPSGMIIQNQSPNTRILTNTGRLRITATDNAYVQIGWQSNIADTGPLAKIYANGIDTGQPSNVVIKTGNIAATTYDWVFGNTGNLAAPGRISATNIVTNSIASDDSSFVTIEDGVNITTGLISSPESMLLSAGANTWTFGTDGRLTFPGTPRIDTGSNNFEVQAAENISLEANAVVNIYTDTSGNAYQWQFGDDGNLTVPGNIILPPGAVLTGTGASPAPSINGFDTINAITFSASGNITGNNLAATNLVINSITSDDSTFVTVEDGVNVNGEISATGNITGNYFIGNGSQLTSVAVPSQTILPTIQSITAVARPAGLFGGGQGGANVTVANNIPVTEYGVIITAGTTSETYKTGALGSIPGTVALTFTTGLNSTQYTLFAYVTSNAGTYYSDAVTGTSGICLLAGTQIALSDGTHKAIEDITYTDKLLSWDFDRGCYTETTAMWIKRSETGSQYNLLTFSDGTTLRTFDQHRIFNKQVGAFTYPMTAATPVGTVTVNEHGQEISLTNKQVIKDTIEYYNVITNYHMNLFSDTVLTSCRFNNIYPIVDMKFAKDGRTLRTRAEFENVPDRFFHGLRLAEQTAGIETVEWYVNRLLSTEVSTQPELAF